MERNKRISPACIAGYGRVRADAQSTKSNPIEVEQWLRSLPLAERSKVNLRGLLHLVFQHGRRWEITDVNPIDLVRQRGGRRSIPRVLRVHEIRLVLEELTGPYRTMALIAACLGLRASEIIGLQWGDFDWEERTLPSRR